MNDLPLIDLPTRPKSLSFDVPTVAAPRFDVRADASGVVITIFDVIGWDVTASAVARNLKEAGDRPVTLEINSPGGDYFEGVAIYNVLRGHSQPVTAQVLGIAASAASIITMGAHRIEMARNAQIMIHNAWAVTAGGAEEMEAAAELLRNVNAASADVYARRTGQPLAKVVAMMAAETFLPAGNAIALGMADALLARDAEPQLALANRDHPSSRRELEVALRSGARLSKAAAAKVAAGGWDALSGKELNVDLDAVAARVVSQTDAFRRSFGG